MTHESLWKKIPDPLKPILRPVRQWREFRGWEHARQEFVRFFAQANLKNGEPNGKGKVLVVLEPWPPFVLMPWYMMTVGFGLSQKGKNVGFIWDDTGFPAQIKIELNLQSQIQRVVHQLPDGFEYTSLASSVTQKCSLISDEEFDYLAYLNTIQHFHSEVMKEEQHRYKNKVKASFEITGGFIEALLRSAAPEYIVVPGGGYRSTCLYVRIAKRLGIRVATIDSGPSMVLISTNGVASYLEDIPKALSFLPDEQWIIDEAKAEMQRRMQGSDTFLYQAVRPTRREIPFGVLIVLNQCYDTSALGRHCVFHDQSDWMIETVRWVLENTNESIVVRRHPVERNPLHRSGDDYGGLLKTKFGESHRLRYVDAGDPVNTYDLLDQAKVLVPHVTTMGIEAAAFGKPVVSQSKSYYADLGFVWVAKEKQTYFDYLRSALAGELQVTDAQQKEAWRCYYITQCCNFHPTAFTPGNFETWVKMLPRDLFAMENADEVFISIDTDTPISLFNHRRRETLRAASPEYHGELNSHC